ncbi:hypothetical protein ALC56_11918 [Trachymyrmex septentrionalis]|uniref:Uncharacterized protein n=1 Tax=Trachymyrmex septentrionalis TaxID=34720 RepID=A0A195EZX1_9HYME|nr:hypothetical protein ALC56_11918 [Trachymyrmex septentrionalis]
MLNLSRGLMRHKPVPTTQSRTISIIIRRSSLCHILDQRSLSTAISDPPRKTRTRVSVPAAKPNLLYGFGKNIEIFQTERGCGTPGAEPSPVKGCLAGTLPAESTVAQTETPSSRRLFIACNETRSRRQATSAGNDDEAEEEEEAVADKRTSNVAAGQSELWDN